MAEPYPKSSQLERGEVRPKRIEATRYRWAKLRAEKLGRCRVCEYWIASGALALPYWAAGRVQLHHLVPRSMMGDDLADNLVPLCIAHHGLITDQAPMQLHALARSLTDAEYAYVVGKLGENGMGRLFGV